MNDFCKTKNKFLKIFFKEPECSAIQFLHKYFIE